MPRFDAVDLSHHNDECLQMHQLKNDGVQMVIAKASEGRSYLDGTCINWLTRAKSVGLLPGCYHFLNGEDAQEQSQNFERAVKRLAEIGLGKALLAVDIEETAPEPTLESAEAFVDAVYGRFSKYPTLYGSGLLDSMNVSSKSPLRECPIWRAAWGAKKAPDKFSWGSHDPWLWQYTENGRFWTDENECPFGADDLPTIWERLAVVL